MVVVVDESVVHAMLQGDLPASVGAMGDGVGIGDCWFGRAGLDR